MRTNRCGWKLWPISLISEQKGSHFYAVFILKFVHCYSKDAVSTKEQNRERGTSMGNEKIKQKNETENWK